MLILHSALLLALPMVQEPAADRTWRDLESTTIEGRAWTEREQPFDRLPARAKDIVRAPVWALSRDSSGICARFVTDARSIHARWSLTSEDLAMPHMAATGVSGLDLYGRDAEGEWRWVGAGRPTGVESEAALVTGLDGEAREYLLYLPLYNGVTSVALGLSSDASFAPGPLRPEASRRPIVFYGTSITQGGCAPRPGLVHTARLGRWLDRPVVNLGFSGQGRMDIELAELLAEVDAVLYVIDCLPNMNAARVEERALPFLRRLREDRPDVPILLVEDRSFTNAPFRESRRAHHNASRAALRAAFEELQAEGWSGLHYLEGADLLGADGEGCVDGSHPTDLGFERQARRFEPVLRGILESVTGSGR